MGRNGILTRVLLAFHEPFCLPHLLNQLQMLCLAPGTVSVSPHPDHISASNYWHGELWELMAQGGKRRGGRGRGSGGGQGYGLPFPPSVASRETPQHMCPQECQETEP